LSRLDFEKLDNEQFPAVSLAYKAIESGPAACLAMNASNEVAVKAFLNHKIAFLDIYDFVYCVTEQVINGEFKVPSLNNLTGIVAFDQNVRDRTEALIVQKDKASLQLKSVAT
jgi:1-deoxy-D-xylulose-5-phosphate reductoisomerase